MGRWEYSNRWTTDQVKSISIKFLNERNYFSGGTRCGGCSWFAGYEKTGSMNFTIFTREKDGRIGFQYSAWTDDDHAYQKFDYSVRLEPTPCFFGGSRWWFVCPLATNGASCNRRVGTLYLTDGLYFGCRHCLNITYASSKENHKFDALYSKIGIDPRLAKRLWEGEE